MANEAHAVKVSGYLEKKAKLRIGSPWKKYWFVLEGRLLLYYRSKDEYETLSPCKGSINLCPPCNVKPSMSAAKVFQIECRASTVTLRAENRSEQQRWLQALLDAIAQSISSPTRMSHFRYSLDDLPLSTSKDKKNHFCRQNTMPYGTSPLNKNLDCMLERLQKIGAHTYGGSLETISKFAIKWEKPPKKQDLLRKLSDNSLEILRSASITAEGGLDNKSRPKSHSAERISSIFIENEQYSIIQEENSLDLALERKPLHPRTEYVMVDNTQYLSRDDRQQNANRITSLIVENEQYSEGFNNNEVCVRSKNRVEHLYERISTDSNTSDSNNERRNSTKTSFNKIRQITTNLYERISTSSSNSDNQVIHQYSTVQKDTKKVRQLQTDAEYTIPVNSEDMDSDKNQINEDQYSPTIDDVSKHNVYSDGLLFSPEYIEYAAIDKTKEYEDMYADPDCLKKNITHLAEVEPKLPPRPEKYSEETISLTSSNEEKRCKKGKFKLLHRKDAEKKPEDQKSPKPTKKPKRKSTSFLHRVWKRKAKSLETDATCESIDPKDVEKQIAKDRNDIEMLQELQRILETRKNMLQEKLSSNGNKKDSAQLTDTTSKTNEESIETPQLCAETTEERPTLPPRQRSLRLSDNESFTSHSGHNETPQNPENVTSESVDVKSIDEILNDLDNEKNLQDPKQNVRQLIEKFSDLKNEEVVLRKKSNSVTKITPLNVLRDPSHEVRYSDELTFLLEELSKVTSAPVLTPGATSSLITPTLSDEEWLTLIPIRRRRLSEPDYDVPRPHRSLQLHNKFKEMPENAIPATRFFGPILSPLENEETTSKNIILNSIDPDSLEITSSSDSNNHSATEKDKTEIYSSHDYLKGNFSQPKEATREVIHNQNKHTSENPVKENIENKNKVSSPALIKTEEFFADSLEPLTEMSTAF